MKSADQWLPSFQNNLQKSFIELIREVQADALRHAAHEAKEASSFPEDRPALSRAAMILNGQAEALERHQ